jgi:hypothetical protein
VQVLVEKSWRWSQKNAACHCGQFGRLHVNTLELVRMMRGKIRTFLKYDQIKATRFDSFGKLQVRGFLPVAYGQCNTGIQYKHCS